MGDKNDKDKWHWVGDYKCNKCGSKLWVAWELDQEKPKEKRVEFETHHKNCDGVFVPDETLPDRKAIKRKHTDDPYW